MSTLILLPKTLRRSLNSWKLFFFLINEANFWSWLGSGCTLKTEGREGSPDVFEYASHVHHENLVRELAEDPLIYTNFTRFDADFFD